MSPSEPSGTLLVPVANRETADRLLDTAIDVANDRSYELLVVHVVFVPAPVPFSEGDRFLNDERRSLLDYAEQLGDDAGVPTEQRMVFARDAATGIFEVIEEADVDTMLLGWRGRPPREEVILGSYVDRFLSRGACDVLVKRIRTAQADIESVLVPVATGPHNRFALETAGSIARQRDTSVLLLHVLPDDPSEAEREAGTELLEDAKSALGEVPTVEQTLAENDHTAGEITDETAASDLTVLGATRKDVVGEQFLGTISEAVGRHSASPVIIAQRKL